MTPDACGCGVGGWSDLLATSGSRSDLLGVDLEGRQAYSVLISVVTQKGDLVLRIAFGCS